MIARRALAALATAALARPARAAEPALDALFARHIRLPADGVARVDYAGWKANPADFAALDTWIIQAATRRPSTMARAEAFAFWANLYNALTLRLVLERYPLRSIKDIRSTGVGLDLRQFSGPWRTRLVVIEGRPMSLDDIEHGTMRPSFRDPRVHYAVNCASIGCPNLPARAWRAASLEADLDAASAAFINHPRAAMVLPGGGLRVSSIYKWFREDFGGDDAGVIRHLRRHAAPGLAAQLENVTRVTEDVYDWALNDTSPPARA